MQSFQSHHSLSVIITIISCVTLFAVFDTFADANSEKGKKLGKDNIDDEKELKKAFSWYEKSESKSEWNRVS